MTFVQRLAYYGSGLAMGIFVVIFFFSGKKSSCDYSPTARVLKNIRNKERYYTPKSIEYLFKNNIDTASISQLLIHGKVDFGASNTKLDSCKTYAIKGNSPELELLSIIVENCDKKATITSITKAK